MSATTVTLTWEVLISTSFLQKQKICSVCILSLPNMLCALAFASARGTVAASVETRDYIAALNVQLSDLVRSPIQRLWRVSKIPFSAIERESKKHIVNTPFTMLDSSYDLSPLGRDFGFF